jgi:hypothetical protein
MLKAVRFDPAEHKELMDFVENYRDKKNKPNHSEAIRVLMQKGLDVINRPQVQQPQIDIEAMKREIFGQIMSQINLSQFTVSAAPVQEHVFTKVNEVEPVIEPPKPISKLQSSQSTTGNPLLANLLGNSQR